MTPPESSARLARSAGLAATLTAALGLVLIETTHAWAERWFHAPGYLGLSAGLTLVSALALGLIGAVLRLSPQATLSLWSGACLWAIHGWADGLAGLVVVALTGRTRAARALPPAVAGACAALALACARLEGASLAEHAGWKDDPLAESIGAAFVLLALGLVLPAVLRRSPARIPTVARVAGLFVLACAFATRPRLERGDGERRLPPEGYASSAARGTGERPHVFVLVLDTVRADHMSVYGYERQTTPELEALVQARRNSAVFPQALANGTWTVPSHASLFTGQLPNEHGAHFALDGSVRMAFGLAEDVPTLAERLQSGGYATLAGFGNHWLRSVKGMGRGFDRYMRAPDLDELPFVGEALRQRFLPGVYWEAAKGCARASEVNATLLSLIGPWAKGLNPLYAFANYVDAHGPYAPPVPYRGRFAPWDRAERSEHLSLDQSAERRTELAARYDEEIAYLDHHVGELFRELERLGLLDDSWVFVTADHGEAFGEHGVLEHGTTVHQEVTRVPLIVFPPAGLSIPVTDAPVSLIDVAATVAAIGGVELAGPGRDLRALEGARFRATIAEFYGDPVKATSLGALAKRPARAVWLDRHKLIAYSDGMRLFDLQADPGELIDLAATFPALVEHLAMFLPEFGRPTFGSDQEAPAPEGLDALRGLGYVGGP